MSNSFNNLINQGARCVNFLSEIGSSALYVRAEFVSKVGCWLLATTLCVEPVVSLAEICLGVLTAELLRYRAEAKPVLCSIVIVPTAFAVLGRSLPLRL